MDTSEQYIKMCEKAEEIQAHQWNWDDLWLDKFNTLVKHFNPCERINRENSPVNTDYYWQQSDNMVWLPRQDQLQEMVEGSAREKLERFYSYITRYGRLRRQWLHEDSYSIRQLWLAFVMKEKYNKIWDGEDWVQLPMEV